MLPIVWICPSETNEMSPVSSDTTMTEASETSDMPIAAVANFCGFKTGLEFWKLFRKRTGVPPLHFRNDRR